MMRPLRPRSRPALSFVAALLFFVPAFAQDAGDAAPSTAGGYLVEVIVFRGGSGGGSEDLGAIGGTSQEGDSPSGGSRSARVIQTLPSSRLKLGGVASKLNTTPGYKVVAHASWIQTASAWNSRVGLPVEQVGLNGAGLSGVVHLERGQYLHLGLDLRLVAGTGTWRLSELRRVKLNERQYYDHPGFGVIAVVSAPGG